MSDIYNLSVFETEQVVARDVELPFENENDFESILYTETIHVHKDYVQRFALGDHYERDARAIYAGQEKPVLDDNKTTVKFKRYWAYLPKERRVPTTVNMLVPGINSTAQGVTLTTSTFTHTVDGDNQLLTVLSGINPSSLSNGDTVRITYRDTFLGLEETVSRSIISKDASSITVSRLDSLLEISSYTFTIEKNYIRAAETRPVPGYILYQYVLGTDLEGYEFPAPFTIDTGDATVSDILTDTSTPTASQWLTRVAANEYVQAEYAQPQNWKAGIIELATPYALAR